MNLPESLVNAVATHRLVPFVGAGVSMSVKRGLFPSWAQLLDRLAQRLEKEGDADSANLVRIQIRKNRFDKAAEEASDALGKSFFREEMKSAFGFAKPPESEVDLALPRAIWNLKPKLIVTTNYDRVLEWAGDSDAVTNSQVGNVAELFTKSTVTEPTVWHVHGHVQNLDDAILAPREYRELYEDASNIDHPKAAAYQQIRTLFINHPMLFIGFGFQDEYVLDALSPLLKAFGKNLQPSYALLKKNSPSSSLWTDYGIKVLEFEDIGRPLLDLVNNIGFAAEQRRSAPANLSFGKFDIPPIPASYREWLSEECADVTPFGMTPQAGQSVSLQQVYVPPLTLKRTQEESVHNDQWTIRHAKGEQVSQFGVEGPQMSLSVERHQLLLERLGESSLYVSGSPGSGKSTFCRWVSLIVAIGEIPNFAVPAPEGFQEMLPEVLKGMLPVLIPLRSLGPAMIGEPGQEKMTASQFTACLASWMNKVKPGGLTWAVVEPYLQAGKTLLILDGADELAASTGEDAEGWSPRNCVLTGLAANASQWNKLGNRILVTSRPYGLDSKQSRLLERHDIPESRLQALPRDLQLLLAMRWFVALPKFSKIGQQYATAMLSEIARVPDMEELATSPLLLTAICIIYGDGGQLPRDLHTLYQRVVNTTLHSRYPHDAALVDTVRSRLAEVAYGMHTGQPAEPSRLSPAAQVSVAELEKILDVYLDANPSTETGIRSTAKTREDLLSFSGLLGQQGEDRISFFHLSFQEFLAAERLGRKLDSVNEFAELISERSQQKNWRPTLRFLLARRIADKGVEDGGIPLLTRLLAKVQQNDLPTATNLALVIGDGLGMLLDRGTVFQSNLRDPILQMCLEAISQEIEAKSRCELASLLGRIGDPRVETSIKSDAAFVDVPAGDYVYGDKNQKVRIDQPFQISKYPVTNAQFAEFVNSRYSDEQYWHPIGWQWRLGLGRSAPDFWLDKRWNIPNLPVVGVSWWEADAFCRWAGVRLPTEREWEAAARSPQGFKYPWGNDWKEGICNSFELSLERTSPVGIFPKSVSFCGAHDMAGNVWEWCSDSYDASRKDDDDAGRVLRGGSWDFPADGCRSSFRVNLRPGNRVNVVGFRVARTL